MAVEKDRKVARVRRHLRVRRKVMGTAERPRLCVYKSLHHVYGQLIDDTSGRTLVAASSREKALGEGLKSTKGLEAAALVGKTLAERGTQAGITQVVFDRGGWPYHGKIKSLAEAAREAGLKF